MPRSRWAGRTRSDGPDVRRTRHECSADIAGEPGSGRPDREQPQPVDPCIGKGVEGGDRRGRTDRRHRRAPRRGAHATRGRSSRSRGRQSPARRPPVRRQPCEPARVWLRQPDRPAPGAARYKIPPAPTQRRRREGVRRSCQLTSTNAASTHNTKADAELTVRTSCQRFHGRSYATRRRPRRWSPRSHQRPQVGR